ncbi:MAG: PAS domain S-box protein, partial [Thermodesulfobacteriota bacterium]
MTEITGNNTKELNPGAPVKKSSRFSIRYKMLLYFGILFIAILTILKLVEFLGLPFSKFEGEIEIQEKEVFKSLHLLADQKKDQLSQWLEERKGDTKMLAKGNFGTRVVELLSSINEISNGKTGKEIWESVEADENYKLITKQMHLAKESYGYDDIDVFDPIQEIIIASTDDARIGLAPTYPEALSRLQASRAGHLIDIQKNKDTGQLEFFIFGAIVRDEKVVAILKMHVDPENTIKPMLHTGEGLGKTGEALLVDDKVRILTQLQHPLPNGTIPEPLEYTIRANPAKYAAQGSQGITTSLDYRGVPVLAAYRYIPISPATGWGLVVKRDRAEIFAHLYKSMYYSIGIGLVSVIVALVMTYLIATNLSRPIKAMSETADRIAKGDLGARMEAGSYKEADTMSETFNLMVQKLQNWHKELEVEVEKRTADLMEEEGKVRLLLDSTYEGIYGLDIDGNCTFANPSCAKLIGYDDVSQLMGKHMHDLIHHTRKDGTPFPVEECKIYEAFHKGKKTNIEDEVFWRSDKTSFPVEYWSHPIWKDGKTTGTVVTFVDITKRKESEDRIQNLNIELIGKNKEMEQLLYVASHDLR